MVVNLWDDVAEFLVIIFDTSLFGKRMNQTVQSRKMLINTTWKVK